MSADKSRRQLITAAAIVALLPGGAALTSARRPIWVPPSWSADKLLIGLNCFQPFGFGFPFINGGANDDGILPAARLATIKNAGFDFVRLVIDPEALLTADGASNSVTINLDARIHEITVAIERRLAAGLKVIADLHFHAGEISVQAGWQYDNVLDGLHGPKFIRLDFVTARLAEALKVFSPAEVAFELFNEPPFPQIVPTSRWIASLERLWLSARSHLGNHTLIVGGNALNAFDSKQAGAGRTSGLTALDARRFDQNTGFAIHDYEGAVFTQQGVVNTIYRYMRGLTYPATDHPGGRAAAEHAFLEAAGNDHTAIDAVVNHHHWASSLSQYFSTYGDQAALVARLSIVLAWAESAGLTRNHIMITETGVNFAGNDDAPEDSAALRLRHARQNAQAAHINCLVVHQMQGDGFGIQSPASPWRFNEKILAALFD